jgi:transposase
MKPNRKRQKGTARGRRQFTAEFKQEAVRLMHERLSTGTTLKQISRELDIEDDQLRAWARALGQWPGHARPSETAEEGETPEQELRRLRRELEITRQERDFLKKATAYFAKESR